MKIKITPEELIKELKYYTFSNFKKTKEGTYITVNNNGKKIYLIDLEGDIYLIDQVVSLNIIS